MTRALYLAFAIAAACGDDASRARLDAPAHGGDGATSIDAPPAPPPPALGDQLDRAGRPAIDVALVHGFDPNATTATAARRGYAEDSAAGTWGATYGAELANNLAILDGFDGVCGNQLDYDGVYAGQGSATQASYAALAALLALDVLVVNTAKASCPYYLSVELELLKNPSATLATCGGRKPSFDAIDAEYSAFAAGVAGFDFATSDGTPAPRFGDGATVHADLTEAQFPFLGAPHVVH